MRSHHRFTISDWNRQGLDRNWAIGFKVSRKEKLSIIPIEGSIDQDNNNQQ